MSGKQGWVSLEATKTSKAPRKILRRYSQDLRGCVLYQPTGIYYVFPKSNTSRLLDNLYIAQKYSRKNTWSVFCIFSDLKSPNQISDNERIIASFHQNPQFCNRWRYKVPPLGGAILANYIFKTLWAITPPCRATSERSSKWVPSNLGWINSWNFLLTVAYYIVNQIWFQSDSLVLKMIVISLIALYHYFTLLEMSHSINHQQCREEKNVRAW